jgi:outer membrane immunogenic protein
MKFIPVAVAFLLTSTTAFAADLAPQPAAPIAPAETPFSWTGFYVGLNAGYHWGSGDFPFAIADTGTGGLSEFSALGAIPSKGVSNIGGAAVGAQVGYNHQFGQFVLGAEADIDWLSGRKSESSSLGEDNVTLFSTSNSRSMDYFGTARVRLGFAPIDRLLIYETGGLAFGDAKSSFSLAVPIAQPPLAASASARSDIGWTVGGGVEYAMTEHWTVKAEYLYYDLGNKSSTVSFNYGNDTTSMTGRAKNNGNLMRLGFNYKF